MTTPGSASNQLPEDIPVLIDADRIAQRVSELAAELDAALAAVGLKQKIVHEVVASLAWLSAVELDVASE